MGFLLPPSSAADFEPGMKGQRPAEPLLRLQPKSFSSTQPAAEELGSMTGSFENLRSVVFAPAAPDSILYAG